MGAPAVSYGPTEGETRDFGRAFRLPDLLSRTCCDFIALHKKLEMIVDGDLGCFSNEEQKYLTTEFLISLEGPLDCKRIDDVLDDWLDGCTELPPPPGRFVGLARAHSARLRASAGKTFTRCQPEIKRAVGHACPSEWKSAKYSRLKFEKPGRQH